MTIKIQNKSNKRDNNSNNNGDDNMKKKGNNIDSICRNKIKLNNIVND